jgi:GNAT superfamily N-acetyltransferase/predicted nucleotidyltransferase
MRAEEFLVEGATSVLYHYAGITAARDILRDGAFKLSSTTGNSSEAGYAPRGYQYFLSTTRSRVGDYHRYVGSGAAMFVLDGAWLGQRYPVKPIDYWERAWQHSPDRTRESEDRVFSQDNTIPIACVRGLHVLMKEQSEVRSPATREMLILAKQRKIPAYLYMDETAWRLQDTRRAVSIQQAADVLRGPKPTPRSYRSRNFLEEILEMIFKKHKSELTDGAQKRVRNLLIYGSRHPTEDDGLGVDMSNARKPGSSDYDSAVKINQFMRARGLKNTVELKNFLVQKWEATDFFKESLEEDTINIGPADHKAQAWIEKVYAKYPATWQNNHVMMWGEGDDQQLAFFELIPSMSKKDAVEVKWFQAYPLRQGVGSRAMKELQALAQEDNIALTLYPWDKGQVSQAKLTKFYKGQGFQPTVKGAKNMIWSPEGVAEAFDQPYKGKWEKSDYGDVDMLVKLPDGTNLSIMFNNQQGDEGEEVVQVEFYRNNSQDVTGEGDAQRIFATVLDAIQKYIKKYKPQRLSFSASKAVDMDADDNGAQFNPESRAKLYDRLVQRYSKALGYRAFRADNGDIVIYELSRLKPAVAEGKQPGKPVVDAIQKVLPVAQEIWFHGSRATGQHRKNSDTDILVVVPDNLVGDQYLSVVRILQKLSSHFDNYDIQPTKLGTNIHRIAQEEGRLLWSSKQGVVENFNGIDIDMDIEGDEIMVRAMAKGRELGHVLFVDEGEYLMPQDLEVDDRYQGQGIAAAMYDYVKSKGYKIRRSGQQTDAGAGFWAKHRPEQNVWEQGVAEGAEAITFAGKDPMLFKSPNGGIPTMVIVTAQGSRYLITSDGMVLRNKSFHANTGGQDQGLKSWSDAIEFYDPSEKPGGVSFPMSVAKAVEKRLPVGLSKTNDGKRALLIYDGKQWRIAKISDVYKNVASVDAPIVSTYSKTPKLNWNVLDYTLGPNNTLKSVHPGSPVTHGSALKKQGVAEGWKDLAVGGAMALGALGAGAQTMPDINVKQVELANKYYNVLVQRAKEDGRELDTRTLNVLKAKAQDAAAKKTQQSSQQQGFPSPGSERKVAKDAGQFESQGVAENFADGKGPGRAGDSQRHGIRKGATMAELEKASHAKGRKGQLARWQLNMRRGHKK